jgi:NADPH:quinone reductase-like Zn-dependent oxidoreductase
MTISREQQMKSYRANLGGGICGITQHHGEMPRPGSHDVLIRMRAASINARDSMILRGHYTLPVKPDCVLLADGAGEIVEVGSAVSRFKAGDRVVCTVFPRWLDGRFTLDCSAQIGGSLDGTLTQFVAAHEDAAVYIPDHLSYEEAATLPCAALTAWNALTGNHPPLPGETVLVLGSGGVSLFALQFAKMFGTRVIATTSSDEKAGRLKTLGADEVINYRNEPEWHNSVRQLTNGRGIDHIIEVGGAGTLESSLKSLALEGQIAIVGWLANQTSSIDVRAIAGSVATMRRVVVGSRALLVAMNRPISANKLRPIIDRVFPFEDAVSALRYYEEGACFGKVVISIN